MDGKDLGIERLAAIRADRESGASELARRALADIAELAHLQPAATISDLKRQMLDFAAELSRTRPSMAPLATLVGRWRSAVAAVDVASLDECRRMLAGAAESLIEVSRRAVAEAAQRCSALVPFGSTIITHSRSSTVLAVFERLTGGSVSAIVSESRPLCEGHALAAELGRRGVATELVTDAQLGRSAADADLALVGADAVLADGSVVNKAGTLLLALAAHEANVPLWVCFESFKHSPVIPDEYLLEEQDPEELALPAQANVRIRNVYFDVTPSRLVSRWFDEGGVRTEWPEG